jgi:hypothetical protein
MFISYAASKVSGDLGSREWPYRSFQAELKGSDNTSTYIAPLYRESQLKKN